MGWLFRKRPAEPERRAILADTEPSEVERTGPAPPPPRTSQGPGLSIYPFVGPFGPVPRDVELLAAAGRARPAETFVSRVPPGASFDLAAAAAAETSVLVLSGAFDVEEPGSRSIGPGDAYVTAAGQPVNLTNRGGEPVRALIDVAGPGVRAVELPRAAPRRIGREELVGRPFSGITGIRALWTARASLGVRLGPPPGARWVLVGLRGLAVFHGKLVVIDGEEPSEVHAGHLIVVADPTATLYVQAGNDAALAIGFASPDLVVALG